MIGLDGKDNPALVVIDIVNDFVTGVFGSDRAKSTADRISRQLKKIGDRVPVIFTRDSHIKGDPEFKVWGEHCMEGTYGSELYPGLSGIGGFHIRKRHFDSFFESDLDGLLRALSVGRLYMFGISTDICVQHTVAGAFFRYYDITVVDDLCASIDPETHADAIERMKINYGIRVIGSEQLIREVS